jgi:hypothetical protein
MVMRLFNTELAFRNVALDRGEQGSRQAQELRRRWQVRGSHCVGVSFLMLMELSSRRFAKKSTLLMR